MSDGLPGAPELAYRGGALHLEDQRLAAIADRAGTPFYCYSAAHIERQYRRFAAAFAGTDAAIFYSVKANSNIAVIATLARLGAGADVVSEGEFRRALAAGIPGERVVFSGIGKTASELRFALEHGVRQINVESFPELALVSEVASALGQRAPVSIRVNPDVDALTHAKITTGLAENKFGIDLAHAAEAFARMRATARARAGRHRRPYRLAARPRSRRSRRRSRASLALVAQLRREGFAIERLDLGGGLGIRYRDESPPAIEDYAAMVRRLAGPLNVRLAFEPGRFIVGNAGVLVARVLYVKEGVTRRFVVLDAAMNDLVRPAMYDAWHEIVPLASPAPGAALAPADVVGPVCETGDSFAAARPLPPLAAGDLVALLSAGAYGAVDGFGLQYALAGARNPGAGQHVRGGPATAEL